MHARKHARTAQLDALLRAFRECDDLMEKLVDDNPKGYIVQTHKKVERLGADGTITRDTVLVSDEFVPCALKQYEGRPMVEFGTFDAAMDEFFSQFESQKIALAQLEQESAAVKKVGRHAHCAQRTRWRAPSVRRAAQRSQASRPPRAWVGL
jgi:hypothetical protein